MNDRDKEIEQIAESIINPKTDPITTFCIGANWADAHLKEYIKNELASYATLRPLYAELKVDNIKLTNELKSADKSFGLVVVPLLSSVQLFCFRNSLPCAKGAPACMKSQSSCPGARSALECAAVAAMAPL